MALEDRPPYSITDKGLEFRIHPCVSKKTLRDIVREINFIAIPLACYRVFGQSSDLEKEGLALKLNKTDKTINWYRIGLCHDGHRQKMGPHKFPDDYDYTPVKVHECRLMILSLLEYSTESRIAWCKVTINYHVGDIDQCVFNTKFVGTTDATLYFAMASLERTD